MFRESRDRRAFIALLVTYALEYFGYLLVVPLLPTLILSVDGRILPVGATDAARILWVGLLLGLFGLAQFFAAPLLGAAADRFGCRRLLLASVAGSALGHAIVAAGIYHHSLLIMLAGRLWSGLSSAGMALSQAAVSRLVRQEDRSRAFGYLLGFGAIGAIVGPLVGGHCVSVGPFRGSLPLLIGCVTSVFNFTVLSLFLVENVSGQKIKQQLRDLPRLFRSRVVRALLLVLLLFFLGRAGYSLFFSTYLAQRYALSSHAIGYLYAYMGTVFFLFGVGVNDRLVRRFSPKFLSSAGMITNGVGAVMTALCPDYHYLIVAIPVCSLGSAIAQPNLSALLSAAVPETHQGRVFGISSSLWSLSQAVSPILAGLFARWGHWLPIAACAACYLLAGYRLKKIAVSNSLSSPIDDTP